MSSKTLIFFYGLLVLQQLTIMDRELRAKEEEMNIRQLLIQYSATGLDVYEILAKQ